MNEQGSKLFIHFLNRIYYIKSHLSERLDEVNESPLFSDFQYTITEALSSLRLQLNEGDKLFEKLGTTASMSGFEPIFHLLESVFTVIQSSENTAPLLSLLDYISIADVLLAETAKIAEIHGFQLAAAYASEHNLYFNSTLQPLKALLEESTIVV